MKKLKNFYPILLAAGLIIVLMLASTYIFSQQPVMNFTDNGDLPKSYQSDKSVKIMLAPDNPFDQGDVIIAHVGEYFINKVEWNSEYGMNLMAWYEPDTDPKAPEGIRAGVQLGDIVRLALMRDNNLYEIELIYTLLYSSGFKMVDEITGNGGYYLVIESKIGGMIDLALQPVPYITWYDSQCPEWADQDTYLIEKPVAYREYTLSRLFPLTEALPYFRKGSTLDLVAGSGRLEVSDMLNQNKYLFTKEDIDRGYIKLKVIIEPCPDCPQPVTEKVFTIQYGDPATVPGFDVVAFENDHFVIGESNGQLAIKNKTDQDIVFKLGRGWRNTQGKIYAGELIVKLRARIFSGNLTLEYKYGGEKYTEVFEY